MNIIVKGIVVTETNFGDYDKYIDILTYTHGKISVLCRSVRRKNSHIASKTKLFNFAEFELFEKNGKYTLNNATSIEMFFDISESLEKYSACSYFVQLCSRLCDDTQNNEELTRTLISAMYATKSNKSIKQVKCSLELRVMSLSGFLPSLSNCALCGKTSEIENPCFDIPNGAIVCFGCGQQNHGAELISSAVIKAMHHITTCQIERLYSYKIDEKSFATLSNICEKYVICHTDYNFKTLDFLHSIGEF